MTRELAMVHAREGIRINSLCPCVAFFRDRHIDNSEPSSGPLKTRKADLTELTFMIALP
jgi:hypothetical protein